MDKGSWETGYIHCSFLLDCDDVTSCFKSQLPWLPGHEGYLWIVSLNRLSHQLIFITETGKEIKTPPHLFSVHQSLTAPCWQPSFQHTDLDGHSPRKHFPFLALPVVSQGLIRAFSVCLSPRSIPTITSYPCQHLSLTFPFSLWNTLVSGADMPLMVPKWILSLQTVESLTTVPTTQTSLHR